jgi:hypothetical protein
MDYGLSRIAVASAWSLDDFLILLRRYRQLYSFAYAIEQKPFDPRFAERSERTDVWEPRRRGPFHQYPWRGGFSTINFFGSLENQVPKEQRMRVKGIRISSPGWIDLVGDMVPLVGVAMCVASVAVNAVKLRRAMKDVRSTLKDLNVNKLGLQAEENLKLKKTEAAEVTGATEEIGSAMSLTSKQMQNLNTRTSERKLTKAKILVGAGKRALEIADLQDVRKIDLKEPVKMSAAEVAEIEREKKQDAEVRAEIMKKDAERLKRAGGKPEAEDDDE